MMSEHPSMPVALLAWKGIQRNSLRGFAKVRIGKSLTVGDVAIHCNNGRRWAQLPAKPMLDGNGHAVRDDKGKVKYVPLLEWSDRETADRFSEAVIAAVERENPGATQA